MNSMFAAGPLLAVMLGAVVGGGLFVALRFISELKQRYLESQLMPSDFNGRASRRGSGALSVVLPIANRSMS